jgi:hypothetical protein
MMMVRVDQGGELWKVVEAAKDAEFRAGRQRDVAPPQAGILAIAQYGPLHDAVQAKCAELAPPNVASSMKWGMYHSDGQGCSAIVRRYNNDGTGTVWHVEAYDNANMRPPRITVRVHGPWADSDDTEWEKRIASLAKGRGSVVIENHCWFTIGDASARGMRGFGGHRFEFQPLDGGAVLVSTNMWFGGVIPPAFRERIPDTHKMIKGFYPGPVE